MNNRKQMSKDLLLNSEEVLKITCYKSRVSLWKKSRNKEDPFPRPYRLGPRFTRWKLSEIEKWLDGLESA